MALSLALIAMTLSSSDLPLTELAYAPVLLHERPRPRYACLHRGALWMLSGWSSSRGETLARWANGEWREGNWGCLPFAIAHSPFAFT